MNIPLDNLYHWLRGLAKEPVSIYTFRPHGSKNINDLAPLDTNNNLSVSPEIVCHDQEPLCFQTYQTVSLANLWNHIKKDRSDPEEQDQLMQLLEPYFCNLNFYAALRARTLRSIFDRYILLHSEKNSTDVEQFSSTAEPVYYWSHAIIARDWFRFAESDPRLKNNADAPNTFLVHCRAWTGSREYRLKFLELLTDAELTSTSKISVLHQDQDQTLKTYQCSNSKLQPGNIDKILNIPENCFPPTASADYDPLDFNETNISIILETVADGAKIHLTEKTLRPIACGHPFVLMAGPGALNYLKSYGFKSFSPWIDESYDQELDTLTRMKMIVQEMSRLAQLPHDQKKILFSNIQDIAAYNKRHFFSNKFYIQVRDELSENLNHAISQVKHSRGNFYLVARRAIRRIYANGTNFGQGQDRKHAIAKILRQLRKDPATSLRNQIDQYPPGFFNS